MDIMNKQGRPTITDEWGSFIAIPTSFVIASKPLTDKARWLFVLLREYTNGKSGVAFPSYDTIRERTGWGRSQISNAIKCLEKHGWLSRQHQFGGVTLYRLVKPVEPNSTEPKLLESPKTAIAKNPKPRLQKSQTETPIVPNRDAIKIETTKIEINKIDICESQVEPFDSLANGDAPSVHAQPCRSDINGMCVNHPYTMEGCTEPGRLYRLQAEKDWQAKQAALTVHANGGSATPPEYAPANKNNAPLSRVCYDAPALQGAHILLWNENAKYTVNIPNGGTEETEAGNADYAIAQNEKNLELPQAIINCLMSMGRTLLRNISTMQDKTGNSISARLDLKQDENLTKGNWCFQTDGKFGGLNFSMQLLVKNQVMWDGSVKIAVSHTSVPPFLTLTGLFQGKMAGNMNQQTAKFSVPTVTDAELTTSRTGANPPPSAQAAVTAPAQNGQLRVLSPLAESAGITASIEAVDPPSTPVSVKKRKTSGKAKTAKTDSPEEIKRKADHKSLMNHIAERMGKLDNPPGQAKAVSEMLKAGHTVERIKQELETQLTELLNHKRRVVTWNTVRQTITSSVFAEQQSQTKLGGNNGKSKSNRNNFFDYINSKPFQQY